jgi:hypothetical protein
MTGGWIGIAGSVGALGGFLISGVFATPGIGGGFVGFPSACTVMMIGVGYLRPARRCTGAGKDIRTAAVRSNRGY